MRSTLRGTIIVGIVTGMIWACGSSGDDSKFNEQVPGTEETGGGNSTPQEGVFTTPDSGPVTNPNPTCKPLTCADAKANCGPIGDGCGGVVDCGTCSGNEICGGGGTASVCGSPSCTPKTCQALGANCGAQGDGCGGVIQTCGTCAQGEFCGGGGPSKCGTNGGGNGDGGVNGGDGGAACTPKTCQDVGANCGPVADGCGGLLQCGACGANETCGGGGTPNVCGTNCTKKTCAGVGANCGPIADGCGGIVQCGTCNVNGQSCGGAGTPNVCGSNPNCTGLCLQQKTCANGATTSIKGIVTSPAGNLPIYGATVYVPNGVVQPFATGVSCEQCGAAASGSPLIATTTAADGSFLLPNMPVSEPGKVVDIPVVIQLGRWRKQITVQTTACVENTVPAAKTALPKNKTEGDIPLTAIATGEVDALECVFRKIGIQDSEFTNPSGNGRIRLYQSLTRSNGQNFRNGARIDNNTPNAKSLYNTQAELDKYDMVIFGCVGEKVTSTNVLTANDKLRVQSYANKGGRVYATHFSYVWLYNQAPWSSTAAWDVGQDSWNSVTANVDTSFPKGQAFAQWLNGVGALTDPLPNPTITIEEARHDVDLPTAAGAQAWLTTTSPKSSIQHYTFNTEWGQPAAQQCGRVLFSDFHVSTTGSTTNVDFPGECNSDPLTAQEKVLAFMLFDLASCVSTQPPGPGCQAKTCQQQGLQCGLAGDGCGNQIDCGACQTPGQTCGGGGAASQCGAPACTKKTCQELAISCGPAGDGCGGTLDCGSCQGGQTCGGGGTPGVCGNGGGGCVAKTCGSYPAGTCGQQANGCGGLVNCTCPQGSQCINGMCGVPQCTARTCAQAGANCGQVADGCGGILTCGTCLAPQSCGGGGTANVCGGGVN